MPHRVIEIALQGSNYARLLLQRAGPQRVRQRKPHPEGRAVLLIPGFMGPRSVLGPMEKRFVRAGIPTFCFNPGLYSALSFEITRRLLKERIRRIRYTHSWIRRLDIVAHSMGGLIAADLLRHARDPVFTGLEVRLVTLGTPFLGTWTALLGCIFSPAAFEMLPIHKRFVQRDQLGGEIFEQFLSISGEYDVFAPPERCEHPDADIQVVAGVDHAGLILKKDVFTIILGFLDAE